MSSENLQKAKNPSFYSVIVPINPRGEVLLGRRNEDGLWTCPAGGGMSFERPSECAVREAWEEAQLEVKEDDLELICVKEAPNGKPLYCYLYRTAQLDTSSKMDPDREVDEWKWYSPKDIPRGMSSARNKNRLETVNQAFVKYLELTKSDPIKRARKLLKEQGKEAVLQFVESLKKDDPDTSAAVYAMVYPRSEKAQDTELAGVESIDMKKSLREKLEAVLEKGRKPAPVGEVRTWQGVQYKKHPNKKWIAISGKNKGKEMGKFKKPAQYMDFANEGKDVVELAREMGEAAFREGKSSIPIRDKAFMEAYKNETDSDKRSKMLHAWGRGWHRANAGAPIPRSPFKRVKKEEPKKHLNEKLKKEPEVEKPSTKGIQERAKSTPGQTGVLPGFAKNYSYKQIDERKFQILADGEPTATEGFIPTTEEGAARVVKWKNVQAKAYKFTKEEYRKLYKQLTNSSRLGPREAARVDARHQALIKLALENNYKVTSKVIASHPKLAGIPKQLQTKAQEKTNLLKSVDLSKVPKKRQEAVLNMLKDTNEVIALMGVRFKKALDFKAGSSLQGIDEGEQSKNTHGTLARYWGGGGETRMVELVKANHAASSILHEVGHAIDYAMAAGPTSSVPRSSEMMGPLGKKAEPELYEKYKELFDLVKNSEKYKTASSIYSRSHVRYLNTPTEIFARAFEVYSLGKAQELIRQKKIDPNFVENYMPDIFKDPSVELKFQKEHKQLMAEYDAIDRQRRMVNARLTQKATLELADTAKPGAPFYERVAERVKEMSYSDPEYTALEERRKNLNKRLEDYGDRKMEMRASTPQISEELKNQYIGKITQLMDDILKMDEIRKADSIVTLINKLQKGGVGSGIRGHRTNKPVSESIKRLQAEIQKLRDGENLGSTTSSGKPVVSSPEKAKELKYTKKDYEDAVKAHLSRVDRTQATIEKIQKEGGSVPKEAMELKRQHQKRASQLERESGKLSTRKDEIERVNREKAGQARNKGNLEVIKSQTQMGGAFGDPDLDTGAYANSKMAAPSELLEKLRQGMSNFSYGEVPREFGLARGRLHLSMVDDGMYSGYFTRESGDLEDNARIRIDKINLPELTMLIDAKEWDLPENVETPEVPESMGEPEEQMDEVEKFNTGAIPAAFSENAPEQNELEQPQQDRGMMVIQLLNKLLNL